jgi:hypothetical protein
MKKNLFIVFILYLFPLFCLAQNDALAWYNRLPEQWQKALQHNKCEVKTAVSIQAFLDTQEQFTVFFEKADADAVHTVKDLKPLLKFKKLTKLYLNEVQVKNYAALGKMPNLTILEVQTSKFSDKDMSFLKKMKNLKRLNIAQTTVTDLKPLANLTHLEMVLCMETPIPREKIALLSTFLPKNCRIIRDYL